MSAPDEGPPLDVGDPGLEALKRARAGYLIVWTWERMLANYLATRGHIKAPGPVYSIPMTGITERPAKRYRGMDRWCLSAWKHDALPGMVPPIEPVAETRLAVIEDETAGACSGFVFSRQDTLDVWSQLTAPLEWDLIWVRDVESPAAPPPGATLLGYEPTWFFGDHFSAVMDSMFFPQWHGCDREGTALREFHERLRDDSGLFATPEEARAFLVHYRAQPWSETGDYWIAEVHDVGRPSP